MSISPITITNMNMVDHQQWNNVVIRADEGTFFHSFEWNKILEDYGNISGSFVSRHILLKDEEKSELVAVFPVFLDTNGRLSSLPYGDYGGPCVVSNINTEVALKQLFQRLDQIGKKEAFEIRIRPSPEKYLDWLSRHSGYAKIPYYYTFLLLTKGKTTKELWKKFRRDTKRGIRRAQEGGVVVEEVLDKGLLKEYYKLYVITMKRLKADIRIYKFFEILWDVLVPSGYLKVHLAKHQDKYIAGLMSISWNKRLHIYGNVSLPKSLNLRANDLLYYNIIEWSVETNHQLVDFGLTSLRQNSGLYQFKQRWGGTPTLLYIAAKKYRKLGSFCHLLRKIRRKITARKQPFTHYAWRISSEQSKRH